MRIQKYHELLLAASSGSLSQEEIAAQFDTMMSVPLPYSSKGFDPPALDKYLADCRREIRKYRMGDFNSLPKEKGGYNISEYSAKIKAYQELILRMDEGMDRSLAMTELERIRQLPLNTEKTGLFSKKGYAQPDADTFLNDIDSHAFNLAY